jgi:acyl phosphate:glycerol-3-phosphate acyltransferase
MMVLMSLASLVAGYLLGSIPIGPLLVRLSTGKDLLREHSGRTGATNAGRAAGAWVGAATMFGDGLKAAVAVWLARALTGGQPWMEAAAGLAAVFGHNYSLFLVERRDGELRFRGGAGGAPTIGAAIGMWAPSALVTIPTGVGVLLLLGYASVATISGAVAATVVFLVRALLGFGPWAHAAFGLAAVITLLWALRPNLVRLRDGTERLVGLRAWRRRRAEAAKAEDNQPPA